MEYYYDVELNFLNKYYPSYEWEPSDDILKIKKIPLICISFKTFTDLLTNKIKVSSAFLEKIKNKTKILNGSIKYAAVFADYNNSLAIVFNEEGESIFWSSLKFNDDLEIENTIYNSKIFELDYSITDKLIIEKDVRKNKFIKDFILTEINNMFLENNLDRINYLSYELFGKPFESSSDFLLNITKRLEIIDNKVFDFYNLLKITYKNV